MRNLNITSVWKTHSEELKKLVAIYLTSQYGERCYLICGI